MFPITSSPISRLRLRFPMLGGSRSAGCEDKLARLFWHGIVSRLLCRRLVTLLIILSLPMWPGVPMAGFLPVSAHSEVVFGGGPVGYLPFVVKALLWFVPTKPQRKETLADRIAQVARLKVSPLKLVAYQNQVIAFTALPTNFAGETVQGVRVEWDTSDRAVVDIDDSGEATCLEPGLAIITCRAGP